MKRFNMLEKIINMINGWIYKKVNRGNTKNSFENRVSQHLLFNSLNSVISLCRKDPDAAADLVGEISTYLQRSLEDKAVLIPLAEELEHAISYINIQKARFPDRLKIEQDIDVNLQCLLPAFTLQPIIDNAIRHGVLKRNNGGTVSISIKKLPDFVRFSVKDDGEGMDAGQQALLFKSCHSRNSLYKINNVLKKVGFKGLHVESRRTVGTLIAFEIPVDN